MGALPPLWLIVVAVLDLDFLVQKESIHERGNEGPDLLVSSDPSFRFFTLNPIALHGQSSPTTIF